ncbi:hypothetical protein Tco_0955195 [Tanacetum coccineum]|uniref:Uncharacterized protein n=1 Tax=Tanacetum coccineum TaxID=301880 RepID=A0ABQ5E6J2_9ASTR
MALSVARKGRPRMIGTNSSSSISKTTKLIGKMNLPTFSKRFSQTPMGYLIDQLASWILILVGLSLEIPNRWKRECGIRLILAPKSARAFFTARGPMRYGNIERRFSSSSSFLCFFNLDGKGGLDVFELLVVGRGGAGKGGSRVLIPDLVVMARVGDSGVSRKEICFQALFKRPLSVGCIACKMEETFIEGDGSSHRSSWYWTYSSIRIHPSSSVREWKRN